MRLLDGTGAEVSLEVDLKPLEVWQSEGGNAVALANDQDPRILGAAIQTLQLINLDFPKFRDGRAYSQAVILRRGLGFKGQLLAQGDLLADQIPYMLDVGFDRFAIKDEAHLARLLPAFSRRPSRTWRQKEAVA